MTPNTDPAAPVGGLLTQPVALASGTAAISDSLHSVADAITPKDTPGKPEGTPGKPEDSSIKPGHAQVTPSSDSLDSVADAIRPKGTPGKPDDSSKPEDSSKPGRAQVTPNSDSPESIAGALTPMGTPGKPNGKLGKPNGTPGKPEDTPGKPEDSSKPGRAQVTPNSDSPESIAGALTPTTTTSTPANPKSSSIEPRGGRNLVARPADAIIAPAADPTPPRYDAIQVRHNSVAAIGGAPAWQIALGAAALTAPASPPLSDRTGRVRRDAAAIGPARRLSTPISDSFTATTITSSVTLGDTFGWNRASSQPSGLPRLRSDRPNGRPAPADLPRTRVPDVGYGVGGASAGSAGTAGGCAFAVLYGLFVIAAWGLWRLFSPTLVSDSIAVNAALERPG
jgi:hypothetical protein